MQAKPRSLSLVSLRAWPQKRVQVGNEIEPSIPASSMSARRAAGS